jgi:hypothetical protein
VSDKIQERIALLLNKAESTTAHEAEALREAAEKLMQKYLIDQSVIDERRAKQGKASEKIVEERLDFTGAYRGEMLHLCSNVVRGLGTLRAMQYTGGKGKVFSFYLVGFESDVAQAKLLINSLQVQAAVAVRAWWKDGNQSYYAGESTYNQEKARRSFVHGFGSGVGVRMVQNRRTIVQEETSTGTELVLVARKDRVDSYMDAKTGLRRGRARSATAGGSAAVDGYEAGKQANTGEKGLGNTKSIGR